MIRAATGALLAMLLASAAQAGIVRVDGPVPVTADSMIYGAAFVPGSALSVDLQAHGYVEEEFFVSGTATSWQRGNGRLEVRQADIPYTTRIIVRRPADRATFSGVVHFEPIHPSQGGTTHWLVNAPYLMARGDIYVAAAIGDDAPSRRISAAGPVPTAQSQVTKWFDPERYAPLQWPEDDGIRYEVMADLGRLLRSDVAGNPLREWPVTAVLLGGWSFTGSVQRTFINEGFHESERLAGGKPIFNGYLLGISSRWNGGGYLPLNAGEKELGVDDPGRALKVIDVPVIEFLSEFEVATGRHEQLPDRDGPAGGHRVYEMGGTIHGSSLTDPRQPRSARPNLTQLASRNYPLDAVRGEAADAPCPAPISDVDHPAYARAALDNLRRWVLDGVEPPHIEQLHWQGDAIQRDAAGNPVGGVPAAEFAVPLAGYGPARDRSASGCFPASGRPVFVRNDLPQAELATRYGSRADYLVQFDAAVDRLVVDRWLLPVDAAAMKLKARSQSHHAFAGASL